MTAGISLVGSTGGLTVSVNASGTLTSPCIFHSGTSCYIGQSGGTVYLSQPVAVTHGMTVSGAAVFLNGVTISGTLTVTNISGINTYQDYSYIVYLDSVDGLYKAKDGRTGLLLSTTSATDASVVVNAAVLALPSIGGRIFVAAGTYTCKTTIAVDISGGARHNTQIVGEGTSTFLDFTPAGALGAGIFLKVRSPGLEHFRIRGNSNVLHVVQAVGYSVGPRNDYGYINHVTFDGANVPDTGDVPDNIGTAPIANQNGLLMDGNVLGQQAIFFWKIMNCDFRLLDHGLWCFDQMSTSTHQTNNTFLYCNEGERISSAQHNISNCWFQGSDNFGDYGIHIVGAEGGAGVGHTINITNIHAELVKTGGFVTAALYIEPGCTNVKYSNIKNATGNATSVDVINDTNFNYNFGTTDNNTQTNIDLERDFVSAPSRNNKRIGWFTGHSAPGIACGILQGRIADFGPTITNVGTIDAASRIMNTGGSGTIMGTICTSDFIPRHYVPEFRTMIYSQSTDNMRIFVGLTNVTSGGLITPTSDLLSGRAGCGFWLDTGVSANWQVMSNDGTGASTISGLSTAKAVTNANLVTLEVKADNLNNNFILKYGDIRTSTKITTNRSTDIPTSGTTCVPLITLNNRTSGAREILVYYGELRTEK